VTGNRCPLSIYQPRRQDNRVRATPPCLPLSNGYLGRMTDHVKTPPSALALDSRAGWPADLRLLIDRYPREAWGGHANLGAMARFWLQRHDMFREIADALADATTAFRDGTATAQDFRAWFPPRLQFFLQQLNAHHQIEDLHYFPVFQAAEARLAHGFDVLETDHKVIHEQIAATVESANAFLRTATNDAGLLRAAGAQYAATSGVLLRLLTQHLGDEEDLIIPLILDRGEAALGVG
jgi:hemerythrin-like domain-containing protein